MFILAPKFRNGNRFNPLVKTKVSFVCRTKPGFALFKSKHDGRLFEHPIKVGLDKQYQGDSPYTMQEKQFALPENHPFSQV